MPRCAHCLVLALVALLFVGAAPLLAQTSDVWDRVEHRYAENDGVRIHYVTLGQGPLIVMIHGFPDFWYLWRHHIEALSEDYQVVGVNNYTYDFLVSDIAAVIRDAGHESATVAGHDWGGFVAWMFAMRQPAMTDQLVIFDAGHWAVTEKADFTIGMMQAWLALHAIGR